ncbi:MAG: hypothetical protein IPL53_12500 [Ignavibacteria bacterium]|nr:hypothetical protein [Ignavibacteria bacterium]
MKPTKELFELIKSLSGSEKRYFKLNASLQKGNKNYIKLFDAIDAQRSFDENEIKDRFKNESFVRNLTVTKHYLYKLIFKSLILFHSEKSTDAKLNAILNRCKIMFDKGLFKQYFKTIENGKVLAYKTERFTILLEFIEIEKLLMKKKELGKKNRNALYDEELEVLEKIKSISNFKRAISNLFSLVRTVGLIRDKVSEKKIDLIISTLEYKDASNSIRAMESVFLLKYLENRLKGNYEEAINYCKKRFDLISKHPPVFKDFLLEPKLDSLEFYISSALRLKKFNEVKKIFKKYNTLSRELENDRINYIMTDFEIKLLISIETADKKASENLIPEIIKFLISHDGKILINSENFFYYNISKYFFVTGDFNMALNTLNNFLGSKYVKATPEFESYLRILNILIHYELSNFKLLQYLIPSAKKYLQNKRKLYKYETAALSAIGKLIRTKQKDKIQKYFIQLRDEAAELKKDKYEKNAFEYFDLKKWAEHKLEAEN